MLAVCSWDQSYFPYYYHFQLSKAREKFGHKSLKCSNYHVVKGNLLHFQGRLHELMMSRHTEKQWDGKGDKIKRTEMVADYCNGGQNLLDIMEFNKSLKIAWILKYISDECKSKWKFFLISIFLNWEAN